MILAGDFNVNALEMKGNFLEEFEEIEKEKIYEPVVPLLKN